ncbi:hypothetical protein [Pseudomonas sp. S1Bt23]|jgi:hypothetical protein|nr:hypothetical protein [Pseudomonas sp. S1Bt23]WPO49008.1 hypothetical protein SHB59_08045 [Pseudomonas sp. S1Bt23]
MPDALAFTLTLSARPRYSLGAPHHFAAKAVSPTDTVRSLEP